MLYEAPLKILENGRPYKTTEGIYFDETNPEKSNLILLSNDEICEIFSTERILRFL